MDSGNSGSIHSSSGDEEYDSQAAATESISSFMNPSLHQFVSISDRLHHQPSIFDISPDYLHALSQSSLPNLEAAHDAPAASASTRQSFLVSDHQVHPSSVQAANGRVISAPTNVVRNSKKRTRASRRAPTTVLTTDTSNFRAMVQEFTGIPAPPFSGLSYARRRDLLTGSSSLLRYNANRHIEPPGTFYPSAQKLQQYPYVTHSSSSTSLQQNNGASTSNNSSAPANYHLLPHDHLDLLNNPHQHILNLQNHPILTFHSTPVFHGSSSTTLADNFGAKSRQDLALPSLEELGLNHGQVNSNDGYRDVRGSSEGGREKRRSNYDGSAYGT